MTEIHWQLVGFWDAPCGQRLTILEGWNGLEYVHRLGLEERPMDSCPKCGEGLAHLNEWQEHKGGYVAGRRA